MPPSPAMRCSPGREPRRDNHKRGHSFEGGTFIREKDDDLALFNEMQTRERESFLLQSHDDFEDTFSTNLRDFSDYKLGISIPGRGESSDLLNADGEKNDYDWLLTPPDTPLFPSLDDEIPPVTLARRGRPQSQPITISRSSTMEKSRRSSIGSASPNRLSPSPRTGNCTSQMRGRAFSSPHSSPTPSLRHATPLRRPSPPPSKPSTPVPRSLTPTPRRMSTGSSGTVSSSGARGTSPGKTSRGNSASPKIRAWQTNIPGFPLDAPPNLRTSLGDRPASYLRGSSPASRNGRESSSRSSRQSMSPTASRSVSSWHSLDRDLISSRSKASIASSGDDEVDALQSIPMSSSDRSSSRRVGAFPSNRAPAFSKKPTKAMLSSSAPKRSFDSALRQMDHWKGPKNMFRPLLSSVPSSTFYVGKASAEHSAMISMNSSVTTSSNASSDQGMSGPHDTEVSGDQKHDVMAAEWGKAPYLDVQDEVFAFEKADAVNEDISPGVHDGSPNVMHGDFSRGARVDSQLGDAENFEYHITATAITATSERLEVQSNFPEVEVMALCSRCDRRYHAIELMEGDLKLCPDCRGSDEPLTITSPLRALIISENSPSPSVRISGEEKSFDAMKPMVSVPDTSKVINMAKAMATWHEENVPESRSLYAESSLNLFLENSLAETPAEEDMQKHENQQVIGQPTVGYNASDGDTVLQQRQHPSPKSEFDVSEGTGISVLLNRSRSGKGPVVQGRNFTPTSIRYDDPSYVRDSSTSMRSTLRQGSSSASSSVDLDSARQTETRVQRQLSGRKSDIETYRYDTNTKHQRTGSSLSGTSSHAFPGLGLATSTHEEKMEVGVSHVESEVVNETDAATQEQLLVLECAGVADTCIEVEFNKRHGTMTASTSELSTHPTNTDLRDSSVASFSNLEDSASYGNGDLQNDVRCISDQEASAVTPKPSTMEDDTVLNSILDSVDVVDAPTQSSQNIISEIEIENGSSSSPSSQSDVSTDLESTIDELPEPSIANISDKNPAASVAKPDILNHSDDILGTNFFHYNGS
ncbi:Cardiomyopathy-associated protein [Actinidia chinensis var. chinensis]|uniref:Cardiomyopathy-associated protein n=1 Tax=Actinidia chinensis var. chinensis TaxID=1590841 RepID=A0A2R6PHB3_ACTCC|nr:Cardiomyopathy-associated protein [Actinidia chinensis var. chinensis]